jgi:hypothetical protein
MPAPAGAASGSALESGTVAKAITSAAQLSATTQAKTTAAQAASSTNFLQEIFSNTKDLFQRGLIGFLGLILVLGAMWYLSSEHGEAA